MHQAKSQDFSLKNHTYVIRDSIIGTVLGIVLGFIIDIIFPLPNKDEYFLLTIVLLLVQIILDAIILFYYSFLYKTFFKNEPDSFYGFSVFTVLFFLTQQQMLYRLAKIYRHFLNKSMD